MTTERERLGQGAEGSGGPQLRDRQELQAREGHGCGGGGSNGGDDDGDFAVMVGWRGALVTKRVSRSSDGPYGFPFGLPNIRVLF